MWPTGFPPSRIHYLAIFMRFLHKKSRFFKRLFTHWLSGPQVGPPAGIDTSML